MSDMNRDVNNLMATLRARFDARTIDKLLGGVQRRRLVMSEAARRGLIKIDKSLDGKLEIEIVDER